MTNKNKYNAEIEFISNYPNEIVLCGCSVEAGKCRKNCPNYGKPLDWPFPELIIKFLDGENSGKKFKITLERWKIREII